MSLVFNVKKVPFDKGHFVHGLLKEILKRFEKLKTRKRWILEGPFHDEENSLYYFVLTSESGTVQSFEIEEAKFIFSKEDTEELVSSVCQAVLATEMSLSVTDRLQGASEEDIAKADENPNVVVEF